MLVSACIAYLCGFFVCACLAFASVRAERLPSSSEPVTVETLKPCTSRLRALHLANINACVGGSAHGNLLYRRSARSGIPERVSGNH
jgi:hypothetical protein